jgi:hypothetical protein
VNEQKLRRQKGITMKMNVFILLVAFAAASALAESAANATAQQQTPVQMTIGTNDDATKINWNSKRGSYHVINGNDDHLFFTKRNKTIAVFGLKSEWWRNDDTF